MRITLPILVLLLVTVSGLQAQHVMKIMDGKVIVHDTVYCLYETNFHPAPYIIDPTDKSTGARETNEDLKDVFLSLPATEEQVITIRVKQIAEQKKEERIEYNKKNVNVEHIRIGELKQKAFLKEIYDIHFIYLDTEINIEVRPYMIDKFIEDLVKYDVFANGKWNDSAAWQVFNKWSADKYCIPADVMAISSVADYNQSIKPDPPPSNILPQITAKKEKIFSNDTTIGSYETVQKTPARLEYYIYNAQGKFIARVYAPSLRAQAYIWIDKVEEPIQLLCADKTPEKIVTVAVKILILQHLF